MKHLQAYRVFQAATKILIPSGRELFHCKAALEQEYGIGVPDFHQRSLSVIKDNVLFIKVKGKDIPNYIAAGYGDIGITGSDICEDRYGAYTSLIHLERIGNPICTFEILIPEHSANEVRLRLTDFTLDPVRIATHYPRLLQRYINDHLNAIIAPIIPSGCVEAAPVLGIAEAVADAVASGETARQNKLVRIWLGDIFPTVVYRKQ